MQRADNHGSKKIFEKIFMEVLTGMKIAVSLHSQSRTVEGLVKRGWLLSSLKQ